MYKTLFSTSLLLVLLTGWTGAQAATYKLATVSPDGLSWMQKLRSSVKQIDTLTDGRVQFKIYPGGVQGDDATVLRKMRIGQLHGGVVAAGSLTRFYPDLQIYNLPLQFHDYDEVDHIRADMDGMISRGLEDNGIVTFTFTETGFAYLMSQTPVTTVEQLQNLKPWIPDGDPIAAELVKAFGVSPIPLNITDVLAGLQTGLINAVVAPPTVALALQWHNHVEYMTDLPLVYIYSMMAMDRKAYQRIDESDREIVQAVLDKLFKEVGEETRLDNEKAMQAMSSVGIEKVEIPPSALPDWQRVADESIEALIESGEISPESVELYLANLQKYRAGDTGDTGSD